MAMLFSNKLLTFNKSVNFIIKTRETKIFANRKLLFYDKVSRYIPGWPVGLYVAQAGFELVELHLCLSSEYWD